MLTAHCCIMHQQLNHGIYTLLKYKNISVMYIFTYIQNSSLTEKDQTILAV